MFHLKNRAALFRAPRDTQKLTEFVTLTIRARRKNWKQRPVPDRPLLSLAQGIQASAAGRRG
jgi:hypothetical protein